MPGPTLFLESSACPVNTRHSPPCTATLSSGPSRYNTLPTLVTPRWPSFDSMLEESVQLVARPGFGCASSRWRSGLDLLILCVARDDGFGVGIGWRGRA